ncbi:MAG: endonuclease III [Candidatus Brocadiaceae bacterium]|nr:endonuclease III [Candidatus Brocadiaceae bacterium]
MRRARHALPPERKIGPVLDALEAAYGRPRWQGGEEPLAVLVRGILSQNTSDVNSARAFDELMGEFGTWEAVAAAPVGQVARAVRCGGLAGQKAAAIKAVLEWLGGRGGYSLEFLADLDAAQAERALTAVKGVGIKTARLTLLFGFGRPVFVVDTHVVRVSRRLRLVPERCGREKAHGLLDALVADDRKYSGHLNIIAHGRRVCHARSPQCVGCCIRPWCVHVRGDAAATGVR